MTNFHATLCHHITMEVKITYELGPAMTPKAPFKATFTGLRMICFEKKNM